MVSYFCRPTREHGGSAIFARDEMEVKIIHINKFSEELVCECCAVKLKIGQHSIGVISAYRSPTGNFESFLIKMAHIAQCCIDQIQLLFLCGDLNVNYLQVNSRHKQLLDDYFNCKLPLWILLGYSQMY